MKHLWTTASELLTWLIITKIQIVSNTNHEVKLSIILAGRCSNEISMSNRLPHKKINHPSRGDFVFCVNKGQKMITSLDNFCLIWFGYFIITCQLKLYI